MLEYYNVMIFYARRAAPHQPILSAAGAAKQRCDHGSRRAAQQHSSTAAAAAAAAVKSSLRLHPKKDQKNIPGQSKIEALEAPGRLPGGSREAPGSSRAPSKQGIKTDPVPEPIPSISVAPFMLIYVENEGQNGGPKTHQNYVKNGSIF